MQGKAVVRVIRLTSFLWLWFVCLPSDASCNTYRLTWVSLTMDVEYLFRAAPYLGGGVSPHCHPSWPWTWSSSSQPSCARVWSQETPGVTGKFGLGIWNETGQRLIEFCQENTLIIANTLFQQHKRRLYTWTSPDVKHQNQIDYILCSQRWRSSVQSAKIRPGADCGSDHELLIAKSD